MTMLETARLICRNTGLSSTRQCRSLSLVALSALALCLVANAWGCSWMSLMGSVASTAQASEPRRLQLRAELKSAAEKLNDIASAAPDMIRAMFAGKTTSASLLALDDQA